MKLTAVSKIKNGLLWDCVKAHGSQASLARHIGVDQGTLGHWMMLKRMPDLDKWWRNEPEKTKEMEEKLFALCGHLLEDIFPQELLGSAFLKREQTIERSVDVPMVNLLEARPEQLRLPPVQEEEFFISEKSDAIEQALDTLTPREAKVIRMRYGLGEFSREHLLEEIGENFAVGKDRIRQILDKGIRKLRQPSRSINLRPFVEYKDRKGKKKAKKQEGVVSCEDASNEHRKEGAVCREQENC